MFTEILQATYPLDHLTADDPVQVVGDGLLLLPEARRAGLLAGVDLHALPRDAQVDFHLGPHLREDFHVEGLEQRCLPEAHFALQRYTHSVLLFIQKKNSMYFFLFEKPI
jgi:hypothetical protein